MWRPACIGVAYLRLLVAIKCLRCIDLDLFELLLQLLHLLPRLLNVLLERRNPVLTLLGIPGKHSVKITNVLLLLNSSQDSSLSNQKSSFFISKNKIFLFTCRGFRLTLHTNFFVRRKPLQVKRKILFLDMKIKTFDLIMNFIQTLQSPTMLSSVYSLL